MRLSKVATQVGEWASRLAVLGIVALVVIVGLRTMVTTVWRSSDQVQAFTVIGTDDRAMSLTILPRNRVAIWYADPGSDTREAVLLRWRGTGGDHYGFGLWYMGEAPLPGPNLRVVPRGYEPYVMEMRTLEYWADGTDEPSFREAGATTHGLVMIASDGSSLIFEGMTLEREEPNPLLAAFMADLFQDEDAVGALRGLGADLFDAIEGDTAR